MRAELKNTDRSIDLLKARITAMEARQIVDARAASPPVSQGYNHGGSAAAFPYYEEVCIRFCSGDVIGHIVCANASGQTAQCDAGVCSWCAKLSCTDDFTSASVVDHYPCLHDMLARSALCSVRLPTVICVRANLCGIESLALSCTRVVAYGKPSNTCFRGQT